MRGTTLLFCFATLLCIDSARALYQVDYMDGTKSRIDLGSPSAGYSSSGILKSHQGFWYPSNMNKTFNVSAPSYYGLLVSIRLIDLRPSQQDQLTIFAINGQVSPVTFTNSHYFRNRNYYPKEDLTYFAPNGQIGIRFTTGSSFLTSGYDGFELVYTTVGEGVFCFYDDFRCTNGRCIAHELKCDGHNHCGDQSSLKNCSKYIAPSRKVGIAFGVVLLLIAAACGIFIAFRKARRGATDRHTIITSHPPPTNLPSYPPAYPQPGTYCPPPPPPYSQGVANPTYH